MQAFHRCRGCPTSILHMHPANTAQSPTREGECGVCQTPVADSKLGQPEPEGHEGPLDDVLQPTVKRSDEQAAWARDRSRDLAEPRQKSDRILPSVAKAAGAMQLRSPEGDPGR